MQRQDFGGAHRLSDEEVQELVLAYLRRTDRPNAIQLLENTWAHFPIFRGGTLEASNYQHLNSDLPSRVAEVLHELSLQGIVMLAPATTRAPIYAVTNRGRHLLADESPLLTDPAAYLRNLQGIPNLDDLTLEYLTEAVEAYRHFLDRSAAVMLGAAAENLLLRLADAVVAARSALALSARRDLRDWRIARVRAAVVDTLQDSGFIQAADDRVAQRSQPMTDEEKTALRETASSAIILSHFFADTRNEAGHPTTVRPDRQILNAYIKAFPRYASRVLDTMTLLARLQ